MGDSWTWAGYLYEEDEMGCSDGPFEQELRAEIKSEPTPYQEQKLTDRYGPVSSQADVIRDKASDPGMYSLTVDDVYKPHPFTPAAKGLIGAGCIKCGMGPTHTVHNQIGNTYNSDGMYNIANPPNFPLPPAKVLDFTDVNKVLAVAEEPAVWAERISNNSARLEFEHIPNDQAMRIVTEVLPKVMELYMKKSKDYGGNVMSMLKLGPKASFVDLWRKVGKLKRCLWDGEPMQGEQTDEILKDCIGHILITLDEMANEVR